MGNRHWRQLLIGVLCIGLLSSDARIRSELRHRLRPGLSRGRPARRTGRPPGSGAAGRTQLRLSRRRPRLSTSLRQPRRLSRRFQARLRLGLPHRLRQSTAQTSSRRDDATIAAIRGSCAAIRIRRSRADTATDGNTAPTTGTIATATIQSVMVTIAMATMATRGPTARRTPTRTTIAPDSGRATKKATGTARAIAVTPAHLAPGRTIGVKYEVPARGRYRLGVRTRGSQPRDRGSNPLTGTKNFYHHSAAPRC